MNKLTEIERAPIFIGEQSQLRLNKPTEIERAPIFIGKQSQLRLNKPTEIERAPMFIGEQSQLRLNKPTEIERAPIFIGEQSQLRLNKPAEIYQLRWKLSDCVLPEVREFPQSAPNEKITRINSSGRDGGHQVVDLRAGKSNISVLHGLIEGGGCYILEKIEGILPQPSLHRLAKIQTRNNTPTERVTGS